MNTPISFELAKLLKEKDIKIDTEEVLFYRDEVNNIEEHQVKNIDVLYNYTGFGNYAPDENEYQTYIISDIVMWLYEKHGIWIQVKPGGKLETWDFITQKKDNTFAVPYFEIKQHKPFFNSPIEAYEAAIEYTLKNLI